MTFSEFVKSQPVQRVIFLGSGSGCFDVARAGYYTDANYLEELNRKYMRSLRISIVTGVRNEANIELETARNNGGPVDMLSLRERCLNTIDERIKALKKTFVPVENRAVKEAYKRVQKDGICVIIEGGDMSSCTNSYWFASEKYGPAGAPKYIVRR